MSRNDAIRTARRSLTPRIAGALLAAALVCAGALPSHAQVRRPLRPAAPRYAAQRPVYTRPAANPQPAPIEHRYLRTPESSSASSFEYAQTVQPPRRPVIVRRPPPARQQPAPAAQSAPPIETRPAAQPPAPPAQQRPMQNQAGTPVQRPMQNQTGAPLQRPAPNNNAGGATSSLVSPNHPGQAQLHLPAWMEAHRNLPIAEQQRALNNETGFRDLKPEEQERLHQQLTHLNAMAPDQRARRIQQNEYMERLAPAQQRRVTNAMTQLGSLPEYRQHAVHLAFYQLRDMPPAQRQAYMNSPQFRGQFNDQERGAINGLLDITPLWPPIQAQQPPH